MKQLLKHIYALLPLKKELFIVLNFFFNLPEHIYKHLHFKGVFTVKLPDSKTFKIKHHGYQIENEIFWAGLTNGWEKESIKLWIKLCENAPVIFDIGANTGIYALIAKTINPSAAVYAFEPIKSVFSKLKENTNMNGFSVICEEKAVSNTDGTASIFLRNEEHTLSVTVNKNLAPEGCQVKEVKIETITLNSYVKQHKINQINLMKIDVETHEPEVLEGFSEYISLFKPTLLIEILSDEIGASVEKLIQGMGYLYFNIDENNGIRKVDKITQSDYYNYLLCNAEIAKELKLTP